MEYNEPVFRPPSEANSLIIQVTLGCSHNRCKFCMMYKTKRFRARPVRDVMADIEWCARRVGPDVQRVFLADGDALVLSTERLAAILDGLDRAFPRLERVTCYANPSNLLRNCL